MSTKTNFYWVFVSRIMTEKRIGEGGRVCVGLQGEDVSMYF